MKLKNWLASVLLLITAMLTTTFGAFVGVNIGTDVSDMPSALNIVSILKAHQITHVRLYDANAHLLQALSNTSIDVIVGVTNEEVLRIGESPSAAAAWINKNVVTYVPSTNITVIAVGSEVLSTIPNVVPILVPALNSLHSYNNKTKTNSSNISSFPFSLPFPSSITRPTPFPTSPSIPPPTVQTFNNHYSRIIHKISLQLHPADIKNAQKIYTKTTKNFIENVYLNLTPNDLRTSQHNLNSEPPASDNNNNSEAFKTYNNQNSESIRVEEKNWNKQNIDFQPSHVVFIVFCRLSIWLKKTKEMETLLQRQKDVTTVFHLLAQKRYPTHLLKTPISPPLQLPPSLSLASLRPNRSSAMTFGASTELSHYLAVPSVRPNSRYSQCTAGISFTLHNANGGFNGGLSKLNSNRNDNRAVSVRADGKGKGLTYKDAGVDIDAGSELVRRIAKMAPGIGGFGGSFPLDSEDLRREEERRSVSKVEDDWSRGRPSRLQV